MIKDKGLSRIRLKDVLERRRLGQALNMKEFAVLAGISYSKAAELFHTQGFPVFRGIVFWEDFVIWRQRHIGIEASTSDSHKIKSNGLPKGLPFQLSEKAQRLLSQV